MTTTPTPVPVRTEKRAERLHPLTPFIRGWVVLVAFVVYLAREVVPDGDGGPSLPAGPRVIVVVVVGVVVLAALAGLVGWYFTRYVIDDEELRIERGVLFKSSTRVPFERLQSVDILQPFAARLFGLAELRMEVGAGDSVIKLHYLTRVDADRLRDYLLTRAHGVRTSLGERSGPGAGLLTDLKTTDRRLVVVTPQRLVGSFLLSTEWLLSVVGVGALFTITAVLDIVPVALTALIPMVIGTITLVGSRVIAMFNFTLADSPRGLRVVRGLTSLTSQSVPVNRIQGVRIGQPLLWRWFGWYRVDVNVLGYHGGDREDNEHSATSVLLPVADASQVELALTRVLPGLDLGEVALHPVPARARWLRWFDFWTLRWGNDDRVVITEHGWLTHVRNVIPHAKTQSVRISQGPLQRALGLADVHLDITRGPVSSVAHQISAADARTLALTQLDRARAARAAERQAASVPAVDEDPGRTAALAAFGVHPAQRLGDGGEAEVFALDDARVLRLYRAGHEGPELVTSQLRRLYDSWADTDVGFEVPRILDAGSIAGRWSSVDRRMSGQNFSGWLAGAGEEERRTALLSYLDVAWAVQRLPSPVAGFARLIGPGAPETFPSLAALLTAQLETALVRSRGQLERDVPDVVRAWDELQGEFVGYNGVPVLVHGDFCPPNTYVSRDAAGRPVVSGVGDFSPHTLHADPWLDVTGAIAFLELERYAGAAEDAAWLTEQAVARFGGEARAPISRYRRYFAFYFSSTWDFDPALYAWCLRQLRG